MMDTEYINTGCWIRYPYSVYTIMKKYQQIIKIKQTHRNFKHTNKSDQKVGILKNLSSSFFLSSEPENINKKKQKNRI